MALSTGEKVLIGSGAAIVGLAVFLAVKKASASPKPHVPPIDSDGPGRKDAPPIFFDAPDPIMEETLPSAGALSSQSTTTANDPIKAAGWWWGYIGVVDPDEAQTVIGVEVATEDLPVPLSAIQQITPLSSVITAYYVGPGDVLVQGYYVIGPLKSAGYGFQKGAWGIVEIWDPSWHGF